MLVRPKFPKEKTVMVVNDMPVKAEIDTGERFSSVSNLNFLTSLRTGKLYREGKERMEQGYKGINATDIYPTYLFMEQYQKNNFDWVEDIVSGKSKQPDVEYFKLDNHKDVWVTKSVWCSFCGLLEEIEKVKPKLIIVTGKWSLFFLTGCVSLKTNQGSWKDKKTLGGLSKFRASILQSSECFKLHDLVIFPLWHTVNILSMAEKAYIFQLDIEKVGWVYNVIKDKGINYYLKPDKKYIICDTKEKVKTELGKLLKVLDEKPTKVAIDLETMYFSVIDCIGMAYSYDEGLCIPFAAKGNAHIFSLEDEVEVLEEVKKVLTHVNCLHIGQNYSYDIQYMSRVWGVRVEAHQDTMIMHHTLFNYMQKDLAFLASLYCEHYTNWKGEITASKETPETRWRYNIKDVCHTLEISDVLESMIDGSAQSLKDFYEFQQKKLAPAIDTIVMRGVKVDLDKKHKQFKELSRLLYLIEEEINSIFGFEINLKSSKQINKLFTKFLDVNPVVDRKSKNASFGSEAMLVYLEKYPMYAPLITLILEYRSIGIFVRTFLAAKVDEDGKMRTSYNIAGTKTYRLASRKNVFGRGCNIQNLPKKGKIDLKYALEVKETSAEEVEGIEVNSLPVYGNIDLPNIKELFICEQDEVFFDIDLAAADARIIAWVSECKFLTKLFEDPEGDIYLTLAKVYFKNDTLTKKSKERQSFKAVCHALNYLGQPPTIASKAGLSIPDVQAIQNFYFDICPEIPRLHKEVQKQVYGRGWLENVWGARGYFLDKNDIMLMNQAMAWVGSSPVSILINKGLVNLQEKEKDIKVRLQVHDSLAGTFKKSDLTAPERILNHCSIALPFTTPRIIPVNIKTNEFNYGGC